MRSYFDQDDKSVIVPSDRKLIYYSVDSGQQVAQANLTSEKLNQDEKVVSSDKFENLIYLFTNHGKIFIWNLDTRDWSTELSLPLNDGQMLVSCKMISKRQYIYSIRDENKSQEVDLYYSMSRSERERPKRKELVEDGICDSLNAIDVVNLASPANSKQIKQSQDKASKQRLLTYIKNRYVYFVRIGVGEKFTPNKTKRKINEYFTCVRASPNTPMVAAGDSIGRIYLYTGDFLEDDLNRTKLHWHSLAVNDLCFSCTGNTLASVGGESGCVAFWDLSPNNITRKFVKSKLGMPIRYVNCSQNVNKYILSFEDNELQIMNTDGRTKELTTLTRRTIDMYVKNDSKVLRDTDIPDQFSESKFSIGLLWHSKTDTVVTNGRTGWLQFYSPSSKVRIQSLNFLKSDILSLEKEVKVIPSEITRATLTLDGNWLAFYETRDTPSSTFPDIKLHIWQRSSTTGRWVWIQTADRLHSSTTITDLKFSPDGVYLVSVSEDGTFQMLHRISLDARATSATAKQMYAKGFVGSVPDKLVSLASFSHDSSVMAISLKNDTTLIWMIVDPFKLVFECQLSHREVDEVITADEDSNQDDNEYAMDQNNHQVLGLHFGQHRPTESVAPLCEVRTNTIRIWNILNALESVEFAASSLNDEFTAVAFDHGSQEDGDHFAVATRKNQILIFKLHVDHTTTDLKPIAVFDATAPLTSPKIEHYYTHMCFLANPILDLDEKSYHDTNLLKIINRLCLMNNHQQLVGMTDKFTLERQTAENNCNAIKTFDMSELQSYFIKNVAQYKEETRNLSDNDKIDHQAITQKQRKIRNRLEVQKMLKDLLIRVPSQNLPRMEVIGPMILNKLIQ